MTAPSARGLLLAALLPLLVAFELPVTTQRRHARTLLPVKLEPRPSPAVAAWPVRTARVRFHVDREYKLGALAWQAQVRALVGRVNEVLGPAYRVRLEIAGFVDWPRRSSSARLDQMVDELEALDPGQDVDWVVGLATPLSIVTTSMHALGTARLLGKHFVVRSVTDTDEARELRRIYDLLDAKEIEEIYQARRAHKQLAIFLHEWAHTLGAMHGREPTGIMHPAWDTKMQSFSAADAALIEAAVPHRLAAPPDPRAEAAAIKAVVERISTEWPDADRAAILRALAARASAPAPPPSGSASPPAAPAPPPPGRVAAAPPAAQAAADGGPPREPGAAALAALARGDAPAAEAALREARAEAEADGALAADEAAALARLALRLGALADAEALVAAAGGEGPRLRGSVVQARRRLGLPAPRGRPGPAPGCGPQLAAAAAALEANDLPRADPLLAAAAGACSGAPGLDALACEREVRAGRLAGAEARCRAALAGWAEASRAHFWLGYLHGAGGRSAAAVAAFERARALEPEFAETWTLLADLYGQLGRRKELAALSAAHAARFGRPLGAAAATNPSGR